MKFSITKPIFKKGNKMNPTNYRPISLLTSFSKVFEKALFNPLPLLFKVLLHGQEGHVFSAGI
jgi:hypothetical protein